MLTSYLTRCLATVVLLLCLYATAVAAKGYTGPEDPDAVSAAQEAVKALGPERGAVPFTGDCIDIVGLESVKVTADAAAIEKNMKDLGAKNLDTEIQVSLSGDILFDFDKWNIREEAEATLKKVAKLIRDLRKRHVIVEGHTDAKGSDTYNLKLSMKRAESVKEWLVEKGNVENVKFDVKGYGEARPVAPNTRPDGSDNPEGRAANRRVEIRILK